MYILLAGISCTVIGNGWFRFLQGQEGRKVHTGLGYE